MFIILILFILFGDIESLWSSDCLQKLTDNSIIQCNSGPQTISTIYAKTCDGYNVCADSSDESPRYCGTGCQKVFRKTKKIINCGSKNISLTNAVNVESDSNVGNGINVTQNFIKCNGRHDCDLTFTMLNYEYVIVAFQCIEPQSITTKDNTISKDNINNVKVSVIVAGFVCCCFVIAIVVICLLIRRRIARRQTNDVNVIDVNRNNRPDGTDIISNNRSLQTSNTNNTSIQTSNTNNRSIQTSNTNNRSIQTSNTNNRSIQTSNPNNRYIQTLNTNNRSIQTSTIRQSTDLNEVARNVLNEHHIRQRDNTNLNNNTLIGIHPINRVMCNQFVRSPSEISSHVPDSSNQTRHGVTVYDLE